MDTPTAGTGATLRFDDIRRFDRLDSTNRYALDAARAGAGEGLVVVADEQTAGRGRLGRTWTAPPGASLLMSVLLRPPPEVLGLTTMAMGLAAVDACTALLGPAAAPVALKWPNDLVVGPRKLAGILAEADVAGSGRGGAPVVVVGMGLNVRWPPPAQLPPELSERLVALNHLSAGPGPDRDEVRRAVLDALARRYRQLTSGTDGAASLVDAYRTVCSTLGRRVRAELGSAPPVTGRAVEVTATGALLVEPEDGAGPVELTAADVVHLFPA